MAFDRTGSLTDMSKSSGTFKSALAYIPVIIHLNGSVQAYM